MSNTQSKHLKDFIVNVCKDNHLRVEKDLGDGYFLLKSQEAQKRQAAQDIKNSEDIIVELLRNSKDANAKNIFVATSLSNNVRQFVVIDDGNGIVKKHHNDVFKPYVTSKLNTMTKDIWGIHGRGMALYSIKANCEKTYIVNSNANLGCSIYVKSDTKKVPEKKDQSTFPYFFINENKELQSRGPRNIIRTCCEFAIENRDKVNVYLGSFTEIASTIYFVYKKKANLKYIFNDPSKDTPIVELLAYSEDDNDFIKYANCIGLVFSNRTARRIMNQEITPLNCLLENIIKNGIDKKKSSKKANYPNVVNKAMNTNDIKNLISSTNKNIKLNNEDKCILVDCVKENFCKIAEKYYLSKDINPSVKIINNKVNISFSIDEIEH